MITAALLLLASLALLSCSKPETSYASSPLAGVWRMSNDDSTQLPDSMEDLDRLRRKGFDVSLTLRKDGTASLYGTGVGLDGTWEPDGEASKSGKLSVGEIEGGVPLVVGEDGRLSMADATKSVSAVFDRLPDDVMVASIPDEDAAALAKEAGMDDLDWEKMARETAEDALSQGK